jgi:hypothetical protein
MTQPQKRPAVRMRANLSHTVDNDPRHIEIHSTHTSTQTHPPTCTQNKTTTNHMHTKQKQQTTTPLNARLQTRQQRHSKPLRNPPQKNKQHQDGRCGVTCEPGHSLLSPGDGCAPFDPCTAVRRRPGVLLERVGDFCGARAQQA